jgi:STAM-binding protein
LGELEQLKTAVQQRINELNRKHTHQVNGWGYNSQNDLLEKPPYNKKILNGNGVTKVQLLFL